MFSKSESQAKDKIISELQKDVADLKVQVDSHEQHGRCDSIRIFGLSEETPGTTDEKVMRLCNQKMKLKDPTKPWRDLDFTPCGETQADRWWKWNSPPQTTPRKICDAKIKEPRYGS